MKLSIITVNLNNRDGLQKTIDSVVSQTFHDFEWIVIDGGSTDGSRELIEQYAERFAYWVSEPDKGIYNAMNKGIKVAKGEYLQFLNSGDCLFNESTLEKCFSYGFTSDIAYGDLYLSGEKGLETVCYPDALSLRFFYQQTLCHNSIFIRRSVQIEELYDERMKLVSDQKFLIIQSFKNKTFYHINEFVVLYDLSGVSSVNTEQVCLERSKMLKELMPKMLVRDFETMDRMDVMKQKLNHPRVKKVLEYSEKKKLYRKMITGCLRIIGVLDNLSWKKGKFQS